MADSDLIYVIPPYLLNTCLGLELQREVYWLDPELGTKNVISPTNSTHYFRQPKHLSKQTNTFCNEPVINRMIREKLKDKFAVLGVLGDVPSENVTDEYLYELFEIFKNRLSSGAAEEKEDADSEPGSRNSTPGGGSTNGDPTTKAKRSVFDFPRLGDFSYGPGFKNTEACLFNCPLDTMMNWARDINEHKYSFFPYLVIDQNKTYLSPLPMYWTPLSVDKHLEHLDKDLGMDISMDDGFLTLSFKLNKMDSSYDDVYRKKRYYNFISNAEVKESTGIFYYEVVVEQTATLATDYKPLLHVNDNSLSSGSSLFFSMGFSKRNVRFDKMPSSTSTSTSVQSIDLKTLQSDMAFYNQDSFNKKFDDDTLTFLGAEPGVSFEGSFAVNFNNSCSYASIKSGENSYRTSSLNMNRRFSQLNRQATAEQETSRLDIEVPFSTHSKTAKGKKDIRTDIVGCGVNFIDQTLFVTLNGILVKTITAKEIASSNRYKDSIFDHNMKMGSLYPMIGFQLAELPKEPGEGDLPESRIITNFGLREFKFNINQYVKEFKSEQEKRFEAAIAEEVQNISAHDTATTALPDVTSFEKAVRNIKDDPTILNDFIKGYLIQEGFLETLGSFSEDLSDLFKNTFQNGDVKMEAPDNSQELKLIADSHARNRQQIKRQIANHEFLEAAKFLSDRYPEVEQLERLVFELQILHYIDLLRKYLDVKFGYEFDFENTGSLDEQESFNEAYSFGKVLLLSARNTPGSRHALGELSSVLLASSKEELKQLSLARRYIENQNREIEVLANHINMAILEQNNFGRESKLEHMIHSVGRNINELCSENEDAFKLINYERDYLDI